MKQLIAEIRNQLEANEPVEADDIYALIDLFTNDTIRHLEQMHEQTELEYRELIRIAVITMKTQWQNETL